MTNGKTPDFPSLTPGRRTADEQQVETFALNLSAFFAVGRRRRPVTTQFLAELDRWVKSSRVTPAELDRLYGLATRELKFMPTLAELVDLLPRARIARLPEPKPEGPEMDESEVKQMLAELNQAIAG